MNKAFEEAKDEIRKLKVQLELEKEHIAQLEKLLNHDPDTGLLQKHVLVQRMRKIIQMEEKPFAFGIVRLDRNYQKIRHTRDRMKVLLYVTSERIKEIVGEENVYQSDRSDEFLIILQDTEDIEYIQRRMEHISRRVMEYQNPPASEISFGCHIGVALYPEHAKTLEDLQVNAEIALGIYEQKKDNGFIYTPELGDIHHHREALDTVLTKSIRDNFNGFYLVFQPLISKDKQLVGAEALLRWESEEYGSVSPSQFIPMAENSGLIIYLGRWVLYHALRQLKKWREQYNTDMYISINVSPIQLSGAHCVEIINDSITALQLPGKSVHLEVTEGSVMEDPDKVCNKLNEIRDLGVRIMLDDFGTGYSSLSYLNQFPIDTLKIAKEFIDNFPHDKKSKETVRAILSLARNFGFTTLAEGVEKQEQLDHLLDEGCDFIQGYYFSPPISPTEFEEHYFEKE